MHPAALPISELMQQCAIRTTRRSGPGGQHRNKVETAVVIEHLPTGLVAEANERRSQQLNRMVAIHRLRLLLAIEYREIVEPASADSMAVTGSTNSIPILPDAIAESPNTDNQTRAVPSSLWLSRAINGRVVVSSEHDDFPALLAEAMDKLSNHGWSLATTASDLRITGSQLLKLLKLWPAALVKANWHRRQLKLRPWH